MNERMIELYKEASEFAYKVCKEEGRTGGTGDHIWNTLATGRFAELIVRECAAKAWWAEQYDMGNGKPISKQITEHFGVEE